MWLETSSEEAWQPCAYCNRIPTAYSCNQAAWWGLQEGVSREEVASLIEELLRDKAAMLQEYFGIRVDADGCLCALPQLIEGYVPDLDYLPTFVLGLARDVDWSSEQQCFHDVAEVRCAVKIQPPAHLLHLSPWSAEAAQDLAVPGAVDHGHE